MFCSSRSAPIVELLSIASVALLSSFILYEQGFAEQTGSPRSFFAADYEKQIAGVIDEENRLVWSIPIRDIHDAQQLSSGNWLLQTNFQEVREINSQGDLVWKYQPKPEAGVDRVEIHAFQFLPSTNEWMIAESGNSRIVLLGDNREPIHTFPLQVSKPDPHRDTRLVRTTPNGTFLVCHESDQLVREYSRSGDIVWEYPVGTRAYSAIRLENGNTLIGTGDGHSVLEINPEKEVVWQVSENDLAGVQLAWVTMVQRLKNGNTWIVNCHAGPSNPQILEVTPNREIVWSFRDFDRFGNSLPVAFPLGE